MGKVWLGNTLASPLHQIQPRTLLFARCTEWRSKTALFSPARSLRAKQNKPPKPGFLWPPEKEQATERGSPGTPGRLPPGVSRLWGLQPPWGTSRGEAPPWPVADIHLHHPLSTERASLWFLPFFVCLDFQFGTYKNFSLLRILKFSKISSASIKYTSETIYSPAI